MAVPQQEARAERWPKPQERLAKQLRARLVAQDAWVPREHAAAVQPPEKVKLAKAPEALWSDEALRAELQRPSEPAQVASAQVALPSWDDSQLRVAQP
jgi:hypothetical protein